MYCSLLFFFFKQKTAYEMRISDWSSDVCSSDLQGLRRAEARRGDVERLQHVQDLDGVDAAGAGRRRADHLDAAIAAAHRLALDQAKIGRASCRERVCQYV